MSCVTPAVASVAELQRETANEGCLLWGLVILIIIIISVALLLQLNDALSDQKRGQDLNLRPTAYEAGVLPGCTTPPG